MTMNINEFAAESLCSGHLFPIEYQFTILGCILSLAHQYPTHLAASFVCNLIFTCENITAELPCSAQLDCFNNWGLYMNELAGHANLSSNTPLLKGFHPQPAKLQGKKQCTSAMDNNNELVGEGASDEESVDEGSDGESDVEDDPAATLHLSQALKTSSPKPKFTSTKKTSSSLNITLPSAPTSKAAKMQPGSIKEEPDAVIQSSCKPCASKTACVSTVAPSSPLSHPTECSSVMIRNKKHAVLQTHMYDKEAPVPVKTEELAIVTQSSALPSYGCAQCSSSIQNQPCLFLGWGKKCNNCKVASKSELANFVDVTLKNVQACIGHTGAALNVFKSSTNATAQAAQQFKTSLEEMLQLCCCTSDSEGQDALHGIVFQDSDFKDWLCSILHGLDKQVSFPSLGTVIGDPKVEDVVFHMKQVFDKHLKCAAAVTSTIAAATGIPSTAPTVPVPSTPAAVKTTATSGKGKAAKVPVSIITAVEEDTVMGNLDTSSAPLETDLVLFYPQLAVSKPLSPWLYPGWKRAPGWLLTMAETG
ncbi:hypothetical protein EDD18DRAFT_1358365 [Armillaria luteobubalina]|uniref:Uncharacterized protein n=1 Tax=Armillaria luteobubalina TaxID=153913 RepID=A0AA39PWN7_9AGAR|nr:hypothetical protein EDD18DRAFT_1358365 [Armillaria luteobubalina]